MVMGAPSGKTPRFRRKKPRHPVHQKKKANRVRLDQTQGTAMAPLPVSSSFMITLMIVEALFAIPAGIVLRRIGHSMWWALLCFVPLAALAGLWILALTKWTPRTDG